MTSAIQSYPRNILQVRQFRIGLLILIAGVALALCGGLIGPYPAILRGWLVGFAIWNCVPIGSMVWLMIHRLTGGEWGVTAAPVLRPAAAMMPALVIGLLPVLVGLPHIYPWAADPGHIPHDVARWYLNQPWFVLRTLITLIGWSLLGLIFATGAGSTLLAGLGLAFFGLTISLVSVDWYLSLEPHYVASAFAAMIAIQQMLASLALAAVLAPRRRKEKAAGDIGALLITALLGVVYLEYMTYVVAWYGDLPSKAEWFLKRSSPLWASVMIVAFVAGAIAPFSMLLLKSVRHRRTGSRIAAALILAGTALHFIWLMVPAFEHPLPVVISAAVALLVLCAGSLFCARSASPWLEARHAE